jgi:hypothetical protein
LHGFAGSVKKYNVTEVAKLWEAAIPSQENGGLRYLRKRYFATAVATIATVTVKKLVV